MGAGQWHQAWSLIGSLTRVVDYLQLSVEPDHDGRQCLLAPLTLLDEPQDHAEGEERKRVFWNIYMLDRYGCCLDYKHQYPNFLLAGFVR